MTLSEQYAREAWNAGLKVIPLFSVEEDGRCQCGDPNCEAILKHPRIKAWQKVPHWSESQLENRILIDDYRTGHGVIVDTLLVVDVDARNGGIESLADLNDDLGMDLADASGYVVNTGSGNGSQHIYFSLPSENLSLVQSHSKYPGIDFKTSGFVVGAGSLHRSGELYEVDKGDVYSIASAPIDLIKTLERPKMSRAKHDGEFIEFSDKDLGEIVKHIDNNASDYHHWISVGMGIHQATGGSMEGLRLWSDWSAMTTPDKHDESEMPLKWGSFGKQSQTITIGTLIYYARQNGYVPPFKLKEPPKPEKGTNIFEELDVSHIDIRRPHGIVGEVTQWINSQCLYPTENLAVAAAISVVSNIGGLKHYDEYSNMGLNNIIFCVAGSAVGKDSIVSAVNDLMTEAGVIDAQMGGIKSEQEIIRNLIRHQALFYNIDELGFVLSKIVKASTHGNATYLEGIIGMIMSAYSKTMKTLPVTGDIKEAIKADVQKEIAALNRLLDKGEDPEPLERQIAVLTESLKNAGKGIINPFLSIFGATTPGTFNDLVTFEMATNGFIARSVIFHEPETNPRRKDNFKSAPMDIMLVQKLRSFYTGTITSEVPSGRVETQGERIAIKTDPEAARMLDLVYEYFHALGEEAKNTTGLEAITRRGLELTMKISLAMAMETKVRTKDDVLFAFKIAKEDCEYKMSLAHANSTQNGENADDRGSALLDVMLKKIPSGKVCTLGVIKNSMKSFKLNDREVRAMLEELNAHGKINILENHKPARGGHQTIYFEKV